MATTASETQVQELYIAYFGRPADPAGLAFYADALDAETTTVNDIASSFATSVEAQAIVALDTTAFLEAVYQQAFARSYDAAVDADGTFWADAITSGATTKELAMVQILDGAQNDDVTAVANKVAVATTYTAAVTTDSADYSGDAAAAAAKAVLTAVTSDASTVTSGNTAAEAAVDSLASTDVSLTTVAANAAYAELTIAADATAGEIATAEALTLTTAEAAIAAGATQAEIDAEYDALVAAGAADLALANIVALDTANTAVSDYLAAVDAEYDTNADEAVTAGEVTGELSAAAVAYNALSPVSDLATDGSDTAEEIAAQHTLQVASLNSTLAVANAALDVDQAAVDLISGLEAAVTATNTAVTAYEAAFAADAATSATLLAATAAYDAVNGTAVLNADGTVSDTAMVSIGSVTDGDGIGGFGAFTFTFSALVTGQSVTVGDTTVTAAADMTDVEVANAFEAELSFTGYAADASAANATIVYTWGVDEVKDVSADTTDAIALSIGGTEVTNEGLAALEAAYTADLAAITGLSDADTALTAAVQLVVDTEQDGATVMNGGIITTGASVVLDFAAGDDTDDAPTAQGFIDAQATVADAEEAIVDLEAAKVAFDAINAIDDGLTPLEETAATAATALVGEVTLADAASETGTVGQDVYFVSDLDAGDSADISGNGVEADTDYVYVGTDYTVNTGALTTGDNAVLEMFITEGTTAADTLLTFETEVFGSASTGDFFTVELTGVTTDEISIVDGLLTIA